MSKNEVEQKGLLGGSFNPVHLGHLGLAREALNRFHLDKIMFIPANVSPHKQEKPFTAAFHRKKMISLATRDTPSFEVSDIELQKQGVSYTINTLNTLRKNNPMTEFYLIMATDTFQDLVTWKECYTILESCNILVASRPGFSLKGGGEIMRGLYKKSMPHKFDLPKTDVADYRREDNGRSLIFFKLKEPKSISSTEIRKRIHQNIPIKNFLPPQVEHYIIENNLYQFTDQNFQPTKE